MGMTLLEKIVKKELETDTTQLDLLFRSVICAAPIVDIRGGRQNR